MVTMPMKMSTTMSTTMSRLELQVRLCVKVVLRMLFYVMVVINISSHVRSLEECRCIRLIWWVYGHESIYDLVDHLSGFWKVRGSSTEGVERCGRCGVDHGVTSCKRSWRVLRVCRSVVRTLMHKPCCEAALTRAWIFIHLSCSC